MINVGKKIEDMDDITFLKKALEENQEKQKKNGEKFKFDVKDRKEKIKEKRKNKGNN